MQLALPLNRLKLTRLPEAPVFLGGAFAFLLIIVLASTALLQRSQRLHDDIDASVRTREKADRITAILRRMESGQRGYLLTGDAVFLDVYKEAVPEVPELLNGLAAEVSDDAEQKRLWDEMAPLTRKKLEEMAETVRLFDAGDREGAVNLVKSAAGLRYMEDIRTLFGSI